MELNPIHILMVDDHPAILSGYESILRSHPDAERLKVTIANSIKEAWTYCHMKSFLDTVDVVFLDHSMPAFEEQNLKSGTELGRVLKRKKNDLKVVLLTSHEEPLIVQEIVQSLKPIAILNKSDITVSVLHEAFERIIRGLRFYSRTIKKAIESSSVLSIKLDKIDMKIIYLLSQGVKTKNIPDHIPLTIDMIYKRKAKIKSTFDLQNSSDEELLRKAREIGLIQGY